MNRFSEHQARIGAFLGNGVSYVSEKTALSRSQWLMLAVFAVGAVGVGVVSTHGARWLQPETTQSATAVAIKPATAASIAAAPASAPGKFSLASTESASSASPVTPAADAPSSVTPSTSTPSTLTQSTVARPAVADRVESKPSTLEPATRALLEGLARDIAKINQKLDDLSGKQKQTANRLASFMADTKQNRARATDIAESERAETSGRKAAASAAPKPTKAASPPRTDLVVHARRVAQRPNVEARQRLERARAIVVARRIEVTERARRIRRRRVASRSIFRPFF